MTQRRGFTLIEVLLALVIMGIVTGALYRLLNTNQRLSLAQAEQVNLQSNVRTGSLVVPNELRELNTVLGSLDATPNDITVANADGPSGASASCARTPARTSCGSTPRLGRAPVPPTLHGTASICLSTEIPTRTPTMPGSGSPSRP